MAAAVATAALLLGAAAGTAQASVVAEGQTPAERAAGYWTPERMENAQPADLLAPGSEASASGGGPVLLNHPLDFTRTEITDPSTFPGRIHGRVFFSIGASNFSCSGTVVSTPAGNAVFTAGHCVFDSPSGGNTGFVDNWAFVPGFRDPDGPGGVPAERPFGTFGATALIAPSAWTNTGSVAFDFAGARLPPHASGNPIERVVGARGIAFGQKRNQAYRSFGYPAAAPFDGRSLFVCDSRFGGNAPVGATPRPMAIGCDMNQGSSGGGWVARNTFVESVNSFLLPGHPNVLYGPHLEGEARVLYGSGRGLRGWRCKGVLATMVGTSAGETINGTPRADVIYAGRGADLVRSRGGNDLVCGAGGPDRIRGGKGRRDRCIGGRGADRLGGGCEKRRQ